MTEGSLMEQRIRDRAYAIWQEEGEPAGRAEEHWAKARAELADTGSADPVVERAKPVSSKKKKSDDVSGDDAAKPKVSAAGPRKSATKPKAKAGSRARKSAATDT